MRRIVIFTLLVVSLIGCTKEIPENEKKLGKSSEEKNIRETLANLSFALNSGDVDKAITFLDADFKGFTSNTSSPLNLNLFSQKMVNLKEQYPQEKFTITIEEITVSGEYSFVVAKNSLNNQASKDNYNFYSMYIMKKQKNDGWKIFRCMLPILEK